MTALDIDPRHYTDDYDGDNGSFHVHRNPGLITHTFCHVQEQQVAGREGDALLK